MLGLVLALAMVYLACAVVLSLLQRAILFPGRSRQAPSEAPPGVERLWIDTSEGRVEAWFLPARTQNQTPAPAVIYAHGNGEIIDDWPGEMRPYSQMGIGVLLPEYRGYGRSAGEPTEDSIAADFVRFFDLLAARPDVDPQRIGFHGRSLGGGAVCALARQRPPRAMILQSSFTSVRAMARRFLMPGFLVRDVFDNLECVRALGRPLLVIHGRADRVVPYSHGRQLAEAAGAPLMSYESGHNEWPPAHGYWQDVEAFWRSAGLIPTDPESPAGPRRGL